ncbi:hypothetical protein BGX28_002408 [Mortierella sp. GBA30]|nr:hypothetical protein BGX28_002408 [Mortierella sp. GBA30]
MSLSSATDAADQASYFSESYSDHEQSNNDCYDEHAISHTSNTLARQVGNLSIAEAAFDVPEVNTSDESQLQTRFSARDRTRAIQQGKAYFSALMSGDADKASEIEHEMGQPLDALGIIDDPVFEQMYARVLDMQEAIVLAEDKKADVLREMASIRSRIRCLLSQSFRLDEDPRPRLFIVLPRIGQTVNEARFRLFFLCDCGAHTKTKDGIHLAEHEGYDIEDPEKFFDAYGSYILTMMQMVKYGYEGSGVTVLPLASLDVGEAFQEAHKCLDLAEKTVGTLIDETIEHIRNRQGSDADKSSSSGTKTKPGASNLAHFANMVSSYLSVVDKDRAFGNMFRIITPAGNVKWICSVHHQEYYPDSQMDALRNFVMLKHMNGAKLDEALGLIDIKLSMNEVALDFYRRLAKARGIQVLKVHLNWEVTQGNLRTFANAITEANIIHLSINGWGVCDEMDLAARVRSSKFDPIAQLMSNDRVQSMDLEDFPFFYNHISTSYPELTHQLRVLSISTKLCSIDFDRNSALQRILDKCPSLIRFTVFMSWDRENYTVIKSIASKHPSLKTMVVKVEFGPVLIHDFSDNKLQTLTARFEEAGHFTFIPGDNLTNLHVKQVAEVTRLTGFLERTFKVSPRLSEIDITCPSDWFHDIIKLVTITRKNARFNSYISQRQVLRLRQNSSNQEMESSETLSSDLLAMRVEYAENKADCNISTHVKMCSSATNLRTVFDHYAWSIETLTTSPNFDDNMARILNQATREHGSRLRVLELNPASLEQKGLDACQLIIARSKSLDSLSLYLGDLYDPIQKAKAQELLTRYGERLQGVTMLGNSSSFRLCTRGLDFPSRKELPELAMFKLIFTSALQYEDACVRWISSMVAAPTVLESWLPLKDVGVECVRLQPENWELIITRLDFTTLETLSFNSTNFSIAQFRLLIDCIPDDGSEVRLRELHVRNTGMNSGGIAEMRTTLELVATLKKKAVAARVFGIVGNDDQYNE